MFKAVLALSTPQCNQGLSVRKLSDAEPSQGPRPASSKGRILPQAGSHLLEDGQGLPRGSPLGHLLLWGHHPHHVGLLDLCPVLATLLIATVV